MYGWRGSILRINLSTEKITVQPLENSYAKNFIGGRGFNSMTLFKEISPGTDPLSPDNILCIAPGTFSGTELGLSSRTEISTLSPQSGILGDGPAGGSFAAYLKRAGYDPIVLTGKASSPKYLWINNSDIELRDASHITGKSTWQTTDTLMKEHGKDISVACIGQAGENLVRFASTIIDKYNSAARGSGAVFGSKNLKAIAVRGSGKVEVADAEEFGRLAREERHFIKNDDFIREISSVYGSHIGHGQMVSGLPLFPGILAS